MTRELNFAGNLVVAEAIENNLVLFQDFTAYDMQRKMIQVMFVAIVWGDIESKRKGWVPLTEYCLKPTGEWVEMKEGERGEMFEERLYDGQDRGLSKIHTDRMELERLKSKYIADMSKLASIAANPIQGAIIAP